MTRAAFLAAVVISLLLATASVSAGESACFEASSWPAADALFLNDDYWIGGDVASSVDLGNGRSLWLFGDSWVQPSGNRSRSHATMVRNSVAIQDGSNPSTATVEFFWHTGSDGKPSAVFAGKGDEWFWPGHGIRLGGRVFVFLNRLRPSTEGLGFESAGWNSFVIHNPGDDPDRWHIEMLETPPNSLGIMPGFAEVIEWNGFLYALGSADPDKTHAIYVARWPLEAASNGDLSEPEWWSGTDTGWSSDMAFEPKPIFGHGQTELGILQDQVSGLFIVAQTTGFGAADVALRFSSSLEGPWSAPQTVYEPPEKDRPNALIYAAKLHPHLDGADIVMTYANNSLEFGEHFSIPSIYYPRFVRLARCLTEGPGEH